MNEEALKDAYSLFTQSGYSGSQDEFYTLLSDNAEAFADSYALFKGSGYKGSEDNYKELLGLKKKDSSALQDAAAQMASGDTPSTSDLSQSSLEQDVQASLEERLSGFRDLPEQEQLNAVNNEAKKPFYEAQGIDYQEMLNFQSVLDNQKQEKQEEEEVSEESSFLSNLYDKITSTEDLEQDMFTTDVDLANQYFADNRDKMRSAKAQYSRARFDDILKTSKDNQEFAKRIEDADIDTNDLAMPELNIDGQSKSFNEWLDYWMEGDNVEDQQKAIKEQEEYDNAIKEGMSAEEASEKFLKTQVPDISINVPKESDPNYKALKYADDLMNRQLGSGSSRTFDAFEGLLATTVDLGAGLLEQVEKVGALSASAQSGSTMPWDLYMMKGGHFANKVRDYANDIRENTRIPEEGSISEAILNGNVEDAVYQTASGVANAIPFTVAVALAAPVAGPTGALVLGGASAAGMKSLELKERRRVGIEEGTKDADIKNWQILVSETVTGVAEGFFERYTQRILRAAKLAGANKNVVFESYIEGIKKSIKQEVPSEVATELSTYFTDVGLELEEFDSGEFAIRVVDTSIISSLFGGSTYVSTRGATSMVNKLNIINDNTSVIFTNEKGETKEVSRGEAINFAKDPEIAQQIRDGKLKVDYSMNDAAKQAIEDLVYGYTAPDAQQARAEMFEKEKVVSNLSRKINKAKEEGTEISNEDVSNLAQALSEMESEGKKSKYNVTKSTKAARSEANKVLKDNNIEIVDAVNSQNTSISNVTETVEATKIDNQKQYDSVKKQLKDGKGKPTIVQSQNQSGVRIDGEVSQTSDITQGEFKNASVAKNAMKEFEAKRDAAKRGEMIESELFPANNKLFTNTKKETLDEIPQEVIDNNDYHILTSEKEGLTEQERASRMEELKSMLDEADATYYTVQGVYNGVAEESLVVTGIDNATALNIGNQFQQESIFSSKDGLMFGDGSVVPLDGDVSKGPDARKRDALTIMNVGGRKSSIHTGLNWGNMSYGKNFNSDNIHRLDESDPNYDSELFQGLTDSRKRALGFAFKLLNSIGGLNVTIVRNSKAMEGQLEALGYDTANRNASFFRGADKTIYVNLETVRGNTLFHEIVHPMVDFIKKTDPELYKRIEGEVSQGKVKRRVLKNGRKVKGSYLQWAEENYADLSKEGQIEEAFAEMMGDAAYGHFNKSQSTLNRILDIVRAMLGKLNITTNKENPAAINLDEMSLSDMRKNLAGALVDGRKINVGGIEFEVGEVKVDKDKVNNSIRTQVDKSEPNSDLGVVNVNIPDNVQTQEIRFQTPEYYPNFDISKVKRGSIKEFNGQKALLMLTDRSASGMVVSPTGVKHEFDGGVFYPYQEDTGVWAFSDKSAATRMINAAKESDGLVFLTAMAPGSIDGSVNMFDYVMKELDQAIKDKRATKKEVLDFLNKKMTIKSFDSKVKGEGIKTAKVKSVKEFSNLVLSMPQAFGVRKDIIRKSIQSKIFEKWGVPSMQEMYDVVNQDIVKNLKGNPIVSAIRIDTEAGYVDSRTDESIKDHPTYPYVVKGEPLMIFDESIDASEVWDELNLADKFLIDSKTGEKLSEGTTQARRQRKIEMARPVVEIRMQAAEVAEEYVNDLDQKIKSTRNSKELQRLLDIKSGLAFRSGDLTTKAEYKFKMRPGRSTGHFGTGFYFFSDLNRAKAYDDRRVSVINLNNYNLAPGTIELHDALKFINNTSYSYDYNKYTVDRQHLGRIASIVGVELPIGKDLNPYKELFAPKGAKAYAEKYNALVAEFGEDLVNENYYKYIDFEQKRYSNVNQLVNDINSKLNDSNNIDSPSTLVMKALGFEGIDSRYNKDTDNSIYGTVVYDIKSDQIGGIRMQAPQVEEVQWQKSKIGRGDLAITNRREEVREAAQDYFDGKINQEEYLEIVQENSPIKPITQFIDPASLQDIKTAVGSKIEGRLDVPIEEGTKVGLRLDIPAYTNKNIWAITVHEDGRGKAMSYTNVARINNVEFISSPKVALGIARGRLSKSTIARMLGSWSPIEGADAKSRGENAKQIVANVMNDPSWVQVGMNPFRHSYFYDRLDGMPVVSAEQVIQIGGLVYAKNAEKTTPFDERFEDARTGLRFQAPTYDMEYTPNALVSLAMLSDNNRQPEQWVKEIGKGLKGASRDVDTMGLLDLLKAYKKDAKVKSIPKEMVERIIATNMAQIETNILDKWLVQYPGAALPGGKNYREFLINDKSPEDIFTAGHYFGLPYASKNLIASARVDDRVGPNGEKILFVQEIQSDWVQGTNKGDFKTKDEIAQLEREKDDLIGKNDILKNEIRFITNKYYREFFKNLPDGKIKSAFQELYEENNKEDLISRKLGSKASEIAPILVSLKSEYDKLDKERDSNIDRFQDIKSSLKSLKPYLPWNQTDLWVGLTIRKLINQASKEGYDQIAFVNGEQSDIIQGHSDGRTAEFYNKIVPKNINNELKRLVKGMKYGVESIIDISDFQSLKPDAFLESRRYSHTLFLSPLGPTTGDTDVHTFDFDALKPYKPKLNVFNSEDGNTYIRTEFTDPNTEELFEKTYNKFDEGGKDMSDMHFYNLTSAILFKSINERFTLPKKEYPNAVINLTPELKAATDKVGPLRFQVAGERASLSEKIQDNLIIANEMEELNQDDKLFIKRATGWERGADGKWRYELEPIKFREDIISLSDGKPDFTKFKRTTKEQEDDWLGPFEGDYVAKLKDIIDAKDLFEAYGEKKKNPNEKSFIGFYKAVPDLNVFLRPGRSEGGSYMPLNQAITVEYTKNTSKKEILGTIAHEVQHHIQKIEGFSKGQTFTKQYYKGKPTKSYLEYFRSAGEVEARNVETRLSMDPVRRRNTLLSLTEDVAREDQIRLQAPQEEGEANVYTSGLATIAWDVSKFVVDKDYQLGTYLSNIKNKELRYDARMSDLIFRSHGEHTNQEIKEIMVRSKGEVNAELLKTSMIVEEVKAANKEANLSREEVDRLLHNLEEVKAMEDSDLKVALIKMREHIDSLSRTLIREGLVNGKTQFTIDENLGVYVNRSYKQFEVEGWKQTDNDIIRKAKSFLYAEIKAQNEKDVEAGRKEPMTDKDITAKVNAEYKKLISKEGFRYASGKSTQSDNLTMVQSIFKRRKNVPVEIRDLWGEIDNPYYNYVTSVNQISRTIAAQRMFRELNFIGEGKFISKDATDFADNELLGAKYGDLEGMYVDNEMYAVLNKSVENLNNPEWLNLYLTAVLFNKKMKTVWNIGTHAKNIIGNTSFATMNGHIGFNGDMYKNISTSLKAFKSMKEGEFADLYSELTRLGVVSSSASLQEIREIANDIQMSKFDLTEYLDENRGPISKRMAKTSRFFKEGVKGLDNMLTKAYQAEDDMFKIFGFLSEKQRYIKAGIDPVTAKDMAARNIINLYPNYNEIPGFIRKLGRSPVVGSFVAFQAEAVRNTKNAVKLGFEELGSSNPKIRKIGATRVAGTISVFALIESLQMATIQALGGALGFTGGDEEELEDRAIRLLLPEWDSTGKLATVERGRLDSRQVEGQSEPDKYFDYVNLSNTSGVGYIKDIMRLAFTDIDSELGKEEFDDTVMNILEDVYKPFLGEEMTLIAFREAIDNRGKKVYNPTDSWYEKLGKIMLYAGKKIQPGITKTAYRNIESRWDSDSELVPEYETLAVLGLRVSRINVNKGLAIKSRFLVNDMNDIVGKATMRNKMDIINAYTQNSKFNGFIDEMADLYSTARLNQVAGIDIENILRKSGISEKMLDIVRTRYYNNYSEDVINVDETYGFDK